MGSASEVEPEWVPMVEGFRIAGRIHTGVASDQITPEKAQEVFGIVAAAARQGHIKSKGWRWQHGRQVWEPLSSQDWQLLRIDLQQSALLEQIPWARRIPHPDRIVGVVVDAHDVRRLLETSTNAADPASHNTATHALFAASTRSDESHQRPVRRGRPPKASWPEIKLLLQQEIITRGGHPDGFPGPDGASGWQTQADAIEFVKGCLEDRGEAVEATAVRDHTRKMLEELWAEMGEKC